MSERPSAATSATRARLLAAGTELLARVGIESVNSNQIARAAGVGVGTFYNHFPDKHSLHRAAVMHGFELLQARLACAAAESADAELALQVRALVGAAVDFAAEHPELLRLAFGPAAGGGGKGRAGVGLSTRALEQRLAELQQRGELDPAIDPAIAARAWAGMQGAVLLWWLDERQDRTREQVVETLVRLHPALAGRRPGS